MATHPPTESCTTTFKFDGTPTGTTSSLPSGISLYIATPPSTAVLRPHRAILYLPDAIGTWKNSQLLADQYAANGYFTVIPDILKGDPMPLNRTVDFQWRDWLAKGGDGSGHNAHTAKEIVPIVEETLKWLKEMRGAQRVGAVGYCFGGPYLVRFMAAGKGIDVGFVAYPFCVEESDFSNIAGPLSIAAAETDEFMPASKRHRSEEILKEVGQPYQITLYSGVKRGFAVRGDQKVRMEKFARVKAFEQAVGWMDEFL